MAGEPSLSYYLLIVGGRIIGFLPFTRVLVLCEMQSVSSRIWTRVAVFISDDDNNYTTHCMLFIGHRLHPRYTSFSLAMVYSHEMLILHWSRIGYFR